MGRKTKIDWADSSWNPVTGCYHECEYCYARKIAERFEGFDPDENPGTQKIYAEPNGNRALLELSNQQLKESASGHVFGAAYPMGFTPTLHRYLLDIPTRWRQPRNVFVCSMADLFGDWVPDGWIQAVFEACKAAPKHRYLFLTKNPSRYLSMGQKALMPAEDNFWYGTSTPKVNDPAFWSRPSPASKGVYYHTFLSVEPILERFKGGDKTGSVALTDWVIVGAETGNRKGKVIPKKDWIMELADECDKYNRPIFMKESLRGLMGEDFRQEFPWEVKS